MNYADFEAITYLAMIWYAVILAFHFINKQAAKSCPWCAMGQEHP